MSILYVGLSPMLSFSPAHTHDVWEIVLNQQGEGRMEIGSYEYHYRPGTIICQPPNVPHTKYSSGTFRDMYVQLSGFSLTDPSHTGKAVVLQDDSEKSVETLILMANRIFHKRESNSARILSSLSDAMEQMLIGWYQHNPGNEQVEQLKNRIADSFTNPEFSISGLLADTAYCPDHLRRLFRRETGLTPLEYLTKLRVSNAEKLMRDNAVLHYSVSDISVMSGFYDSGYFSRVFRKMTGMTPSEYMQKHENAK